MFMISGVSYEQHLGKDIVITNVDKTRLTNCGYRFRLSNTIRLFEPGGNPKGRISKIQGLVIEPNQYILVSTYESIALSQHVLGMLSQSSTLSVYGLHLNHSKWVDPLFEGVLEMGIKNMSPHPVQADMIDCYIHVSFFNINAGGWGPLSVTPHGKSRKDGAAPGQWLWG